jgi:TPR repeat protein
MVSSKKGECDELNRWFRGCNMSIKFLSHLLVWFLLLASVPAGAADLKDINKQLFQVQLTQAMKGETRAQYYLGEMYEQGLGTSQNLDEAFKWYTKAAQKGDSLAKRKLAHRTEIEEDLRQKHLRNER